MIYKEAQLWLDMTPKRTSPSVVTTTNPVPFTQMTQGDNVVSLPTRDMVIQPQVVATNAPTYPDLYLPAAMNLKLSQDLYAISSIKTPDAN